MAVARNEETLELLVSLLERNAGDLARACSDIGTSTGWVKKWCRDDPKVEAAIKDAQDTGVAVLESAAITRAVEGVAEPVFYKDAQVGTKQRYSDTLLIKLLESRKRETYGKTLDSNINVNMKHLSDGELDSKIDMLMDRLGIKALTAPEAEYTLVSENEPEYISVEDLL